MCARACVCVYARAREQREREGGGVGGGGGGGGGWWWWWWARLDAWTRKEGRESVFSIADVLNPDARPPQGLVKFVGVVFEVCFMRRARVNLMKDKGASYDIVLKSAQAFLSWLLEFCLYDRKTE